MRHLSNRFILYVPFILIILLLVSGCSRLKKSKGEDPPVVSKVDLTKYQGKWYEIARLPAWFQRKCMKSEATYSLRKDGKISVVNSCIDLDGNQETAKGTAEVVNPPANSKLTVIFDNWFSSLFPWITKGDYWILHLDPDYQHVLVGTPDRKYLWILARKPAIEESTYNSLVEKADSLGFETAKLIRRKGD